MAPPPARLATVQHDPLFNVHHLDLHPRISSRPRQFHAHKARVRPRHIRWCVVRHRRRARVGHSGGALGVGGFPRCGVGGPLRSIHGNHQGGASLRREGQHGAGNSAASRQSSTTTTPLTFTHPFLAPPGFSRLRVARGGSPLTALLLASHLAHLSPQMGFFGYLGLLNCIFSIPILLALIWAGALDTSGLSDRTVRSGTTAGTQSLVFAKQHQATKSVFQPCA